jgi:putative membrane protein
VNIGICGLHRAEGWRCKAHPVFQAATWDVVEARYARWWVACVGAQMARSVRVQLSPLRVGSTAYGGSVHCNLSVIIVKGGSCMNAFSTAAALAILAATTAAFAAQTQTQPPPQSRSAPNAAPNSCQHQHSGVLGAGSEVGAKSGTASCQLKREAMKDVVTSTAFAATAAQHGMVEVALATLALRKSSDHQLRQLAQKMAQDYAQSNGELDSMVKCEGLIQPVELDAKHNALIRRFNAKSGRVFEKAYLTHIAEKHSAAMAVFASASLSGDRDVAAFAREGLSMLQEHRLLADDLRAAIATRVASTR